MRLLFLLLSPTFGMHQYTADLANRMAEHFEVSAVTIKRYPKDRYGPDVVVQTPVDLGNTGLSLESLNIGRLNQVKRAVESAAPDVVHFTGPHLWNVALVRWLRAKGIPVVHTIHDLDPHYGTSYGQLLYLWNWAILRSADHIVVHGKLYRERLIAAGRRAESVTYTPLTFLFVGYSTSRALAASDNDVNYEPMVLFFGRQERYKGVDSLLKAFERVGDRMTDVAPNERLRLIVAGPGDVYRQKYGDGPRGVEWRNHLIGDEEGVRLFRRCSVVVLPYRDGTQSAVIAAAYFFRKPVIVTNVGALAEYVLRGKTGLVVDGDDVVEGLARAMLELLKTPEYSSRLGRAGRAWYDAQRELDTERLSRLYQRLSN